jgi:hypothetical protein
MEASVWRLVAKPDQEILFEALYGPPGGWASFFRGTPAYSGSFLLRDPKTPRGYVLIDVWASRAERDAYCAKHAERYRLLDQAGAEITESEEHEGWFESVDEVLARI